MPTFMGYEMLEKQSKNILSVSGVLCLTIKQLRYEPKFHCKINCSCWWGIKNKLYSKKYLEHYLKQQIYEYWFYHKRWVEILLKTQNVDSSGRRRKTIHHGSLLAIFGAHWPSLPLPHRWSAPLTGDVWTGWCSSFCPVYCTVTPFNR